MEIINQLNELVDLLNAEKQQASQSGYSTVTLTHEEVMKITITMANASQKINPAQV